MSKSIQGQSGRADLILKRMRSLKIFEKDLDEVFVASPGPGGQNVNKVATCVVLQHVPTGEVIKCHEYRTQLANRIRARELLAERVESQVQAKKQAAAQHRYQERARKRKRSRASKERMLENKRQRSEKKQSRKRVSSDSSTCR